MSYSFLILIAVPLGIYLLIVILSTRDVGKSKRKRTARSISLTSDTSVELPENPAVTTAESTPTSTTADETSTTKKSRRRRRKIKQPLEEAAPRYAFDYTGRLWVQKNQRGFFRRVKKPNLPPEE